MRVAALALAMLLGACEDRRSFDERYDAAENEIARRASNLDAQLDQELAGEQGNTAASNAR